MVQVHAYGSVPGRTRSLVGRQFLRAALLRRGAVFLVVELGGRVVGYTYARLEPPLRVAVGSRRGRGDRVGYVDALAVESGHRGEGLGAALLEAVCRWARAQGAERVDLQVFEFNETARHFYESHGWSTARRTMTRDLR